VGFYNKKLCIILMFNTGISFFNQEESSAPLKIEYLTQLSDTTDTSAYTFNSISTGGPGLIVVAMHTVASGNSRTITGMTIGGVASSTVVITSSTDTTTPTSWLRYAVCTGSSISISVTFSAAMLNIVVGIWKITNYTSSTPVSSSFTRNFGTGVTSLTLATGSSANSVGVYINSQGSLTSSFDTTWVGATERYDFNTSDTSRVRGVGADFTNTTGSDLGATVSYSGSSQTNTKLAAAAWR
jgi:hypothetical protein